MQHDLDVDRVTKRYGAQTAVDALSLSVARGSFFSILGPSGCGKTTLLRIVAGLETADRGTVLFDGQDASGRQAGVTTRVPEGTATTRVVALDTSTSTSSDNPPRRWRSTAMRRPSGDHRGALN